MEALQESPHENKLNISLELANAARRAGLIPPTQRIKTSFYAPYRGNLSPHVRGKLVGKIEYEAPAQLTLEKWNIMKEWFEKSLFQDNSLVRTRCWKILETLRAVENKPIHLSTFISAEEDVTVNFLNGILREKTPSLVGDRKYIMLVRSIKRGAQLWIIKEIQ